jgi:hypothetical protein
LKDLHPTLMAAWAIPNRAVVSLALRCLHERLVIAGRRLPSAISLIPAQNAGADITIGIPVVAAEKSLALDIAMVAATSLAPATVLASGLYPANMFAGNIEVAAASASIAAAVVVVLMVAAFDLQHRGRNQLLAAAASTAVAVTDAAATEAAAMVAGLGIAVDFAVHARTE